MCLSRDDIVVLHDGSARAHETVQKAAERTKALPVMAEHQTAVPTHGFAEHGKCGTVGINGAFGIQHLQCCVERVEDDERFTGEVNVGNLACKYKDYGSLPRSHRCGRKGTHHTSCPTL